MYILTHIIENGAERARETEICKEVLELGENKEKGVHMRFEGQREREMIQIYFNLKILLKRTQIRLSRVADSWFQ